MWCVLLILSNFYPHLQRGVEFSFYRWGISLRQVNELTQGRAASAVPGPEAHAFSILN